MLHALLACALAVHEPLVFEHLQGGQVHGIHFISPTEGWTGEDGGRIRHWLYDASTRSWGAEHQFTPYDARYILRDVWFADAKHGWAVGYGGRVLRTVDGGVSWENPMEGQAQPFVRIPGSPELADLYAVRFVPDTVLGAWRGWLVGFGGVLMQSLDGGATWSDQAPPAAQGKDMYGIELLAFARTRFGLWVTGDDGLVMRSFDLGGSWQVQHLVAPTCDAITNLELWDIELAGGGVGYIAAGFGTGCGQLFRTADWGTTWIRETCFVPPKSQLGTTYAVTTRGTPDVLSAGYGNQLLVREPSPGGDCWNDTSISTGFGNPPLVGASGVGSAHAFVGGQFNCLRATTDGGHTWENLAGTQYVRLDAGHFVSPQVGFIAGQSHQIFKTVDGGKTFVRKYPLPPVTESADFVHGIAFSTLDPLKGVAVGDPGAGGSFVVRSQDGGESWTRVPTASLPPNVGRLHEVRFRRGSLEVWAVGDNGRILRSSDGGATWVNRSLTGAAPLSNLAGIAFAADGSLVVVGSDPAGANRPVHRSTNGGTSWTPLAVLDHAGAPMELDLSDVAANATSVWASGRRGNVLKLEVAGLRVQFAPGESPLYAPNEDLTSILAFATPSGEKVIVGGLDGSVAFYNGSFWQAPKSKVSETPILSMSVDWDPASEDFSGFTVGRRYQVTRFATPGL